MSEPDVTGRQPGVQEQLLHWSIRQARALEAIKVAVWILASLAIAGVVLSLMAFFGR